MKKVIISFFLIMGMITLPGCRTLQQKRTVPNTEYLTTATDAGEIQTLPTATVSAELTVETEIEKKNMSDPISSSIASETKKPSSALTNEDPVITATFPEYTPETTPSTSKPTTPSVVPESTEPTFVLPSEEHVITPTFPESLPDTPETTPEVENVQEDNTWSGGEFVEDDPWDAGGF